MSYWRKITIGDICDPISTTYKGKDSEVILINTSDVLEGKILNNEKVPNKKLKGQFKKTFMKNDILFSEIRPANKRFAFVDIDDTSLYIASTKLMVLRPKKNIVNPRFLFNILTSDRILKELQVLAESRSGTFPQITFNTEIAPILINLPDMETQDKCTFIINLLEEKIERLIVK